MKQPDYYDIEADARVLIFYEENVYNLALKGAPIPILDSIRDTEAWLIMLRARQMAAQRIALFCGQELGLGDCETVLNGQRELETERRIVDHCERWRSEDQ
jgi:hypothetical protein